MASTASESACEVSSSARDDVGVGAAALIEAERELPGYVRDLSARLVYARKHREMTMQQVSKVCGIAQSQMSMIERGKYGYTHGTQIWTVHRLAFGLDVPAWWLAGEGELLFPPPHQSGAAAPVKAEVLRDFGRRLRIARGFRCVDRADLMRMVSAKNMLTDQERGVFDVGLATVRRYAEALDVPTAWLMGRGEVREPWAV